jgi:tRNA(fMet)-specific endonuclease VapC
VRSIVEAARHRRLRYHPARPRSGDRGSRCDGRRRGDPWITVAELHYGAAKSRAPEKNRGLAKSFLATLPILGLDETSAQIFGEAKAMLEQRGQGLADADLFIGAIAVANRAIVVSGNRRHYERIRGVTLEDWIRC